MLSLEGLVAVGIIGVVAWSLYWPLRDFVLDRFGDLLNDRIWPRKHRTDG